MMGYGYGMMGGFGMIFSLILIGVVIYAVIKFAQGDHKNYSNSRTGNDALDILNQRFAKGEISEEEYTKKKKMLRD